MKYKKLRQILPAPKKYLVFFQKADNVGDKQILYGKSFQRGNLITEKQHFWPWLSGTSHKKGTTSYFSGAEKLILQITSRKGLLTWALNLSVTLFLDFYYV